MLRMGDFDHVEEIVKQAKNNKLGSSTLSENKTKSTKSLKDKLTDNCNNDTNKSFTVNEDNLINQETEISRGANNHGRFSHVHKDYILDVDKGRDIDSVKVTSLRDVKLSDEEKESEPEEAKSKIDVMKSKVKLSMKERLNLH